MVCGLAPNHSNVPPLLTVVMLLEPPSVTSMKPPLDTTVLFAAPPDWTISAPPLTTMSPFSTWPDETLNGELPALIVVTVLSPLSAAAVCSPFLSPTSRSRRSYDGARATLSFFGAPVGSAACAAVATGQGRRRRRFGGPRYTSLRRSGRDERRRRPQRICDEEWLIWRRQHGRERHRRLH